MMFPDINPVFLKLGPLEFRWYGLMYILGFIAAYFLITGRARKSGDNLSKNDVADLIFALALGVILGGRFGYIVFYNLAYYLQNPLKLFAIWEGGMSFHGGVIGVIVAGVIFSRRRKVSFLRLADLCAQAAPVGLGLGRIGNFINGELFGRQTGVPWGVIFREGGGVPRHPSQLYEAFLEGPVLFVALYLLGRKKKPAGTIFWAFISLYGLFRFIVEFFREPDIQLGFITGSFTMGQVLSLPMFVLGAAMTFVSVRRTE